MRPRKPQDVWPRGHGALLSRERTGHHETSMVDPFCKRLLGDLSFERLASEAATAKKPMPVAAWETIVRRAKVKAHTSPEAMRLGIISADDRADNDLAAACKLVVLEHRAPHFIQAVRHSANLADIFGGRVVTRSLLNECPCDPTPGRRLALHDVLLGFPARFQAHCKAG